MSSSAALGAQRVGLVMSTLFEHGFRCARISASGQRKGARRDEQALAADVIALAQEPGLPHLLVEVGGCKKPVATTFAELRDSIMPGFAPLLVRFIGRRRRYNSDEDHAHDSLADALDALRSA